MGKVCLLADLSQTKKINNNINNKNNNINNKNNNINNKNNLKLNK